MLSDLLDQAAMLLSLQLKLGHGCDCQTLIWLLAFLLLLCSMLELTGQQAHTLELCPRIQEVLSDLVHIRLLSLQL